jgi:opacity protein-like surface antigen
MKPALAAAALSGLALFPALFPGAALAGGNVVPVEPVVIAPAPAPTFDWSGAFAGFGLGYGQARHRSVAPLPAGAFPASRGAVGSLLMGYNWQGAGRLVLGGEVMLSGGRMHGAARCPDPVATCTSTLGTMAAARVRLGLALDRTLVFATLGAATAEVRYTAASPVLGDAARGRVNGWTAGLGIEQAMTNGWNLRGEIEHYRFGTGRYSFPVLPASVRTRTEANVVRLTLVRRF